MKLEPKYRSTKIELSRPFFFAAASLVSLQVSFLALLSSCSSNQTQLESMLRSPASESAPVVNDPKETVSIVGFISPSLKCFVRRRDMHLRIVGPLPASAVACENKAAIVDGNFHFDCRLTEATYKLELLERGSLKQIDSRVFKFDGQQKANFDLESCPTNRQ